jgi:hypothetical protein
MGDAEKDLGIVLGARDALYGPSTSLSPAHTYFGIVLRYWRQQGTSQNIH